ncbi:MAG: hypothetical protein ACYC6Y_19315 [Thermoguttaceae bacterium]
MSREAHASASFRTGLVVCVVFLLFALILVLDPLPFSSPVTLPTAVPAWATDTSPVRHPALEPRYQAGVYDFRCSDCHKLFPPPLDNTVRTVAQHREILLKHGINTWCLSCHHADNRDAFVDDRGDEIPWDQPERLCSKCHGPVFRDWQHGSHGRTNGYWDKERGEQTRRKCTECHDPHQPPFPPMHPAPGPHTLRMGPQEISLHGEGQNPLRVRVTRGEDLHKTGTGEER